MKKIRAYSNIALIKYWGKSNEDLNLPFYNTVSVTLDAFYTDIEIKHSRKDEFIINEQANDKSNKFIRLEEHINLLNNHYNINRNYTIKTTNNFPMGVGLASSASSYASITYAYHKINNLDKDLKDISTWARRGSGSATRSLHGGFVKWEKGIDHSSSYGERVLERWDEFMVVVLNLDETEKKINSREAMKLAVKLPKYMDYVNRSVLMYNKLIDGLKIKDFSKVGSIAEENAVMMHDIIRKTNIDYLSNNAKDLFKLAKSLRGKNIETYVTADAGDTVCFLVLEKDLDNLLIELKDYKKVVSKVGGMAHEL